MLNILYHNLSHHHVPFVMTHDAAFDSRTRSIRELSRQVQAKRFKTANPKLQIGIEVHGRPDAPMAKFSFVDGTDVRTA